MRWPIFISNLLRVVLFHFYIMGKWIFTKDLIPGHERRVLLAIDGDCDGKQMYGYHVGVYIPAEGRWYADSDSGYDMTDSVVAWSEIEPVPPF